MRKRTWLCGLVVGSALLLSASCASSAQCVDGAAGDSDCARITGHASASCTQGSCVLDPRAPSTDAATEDGAIADAGIVDSAIADAIAPLPPPVTCKGVAGLRCVAPPPQGWTGPFAFFHGSAQSLPQACGGFYPTLEPMLEGLHGLGDGGQVTGAPAVCPDCSTAVLSGVTCVANPAIMRAVQGACMPEACTQYAGGQLGSCFDVPWNTCSNGGVAPLLTAAPVASGGACSTDSTGFMMIPPPTWPEAVAGCTGDLARVDCAETELCVAKPPAPFEAKTCIVKTTSAGGGVCPGAPYNVLSYKAYQAVRDERDCGKCKTSLMSQSCTVTADEYEGAACTGAVTSRVLTAACFDDLQGDIGHFKLRTQTSGTCAAAVSEPTGTVGEPEDKGSVTVCCTSDFPD